MSRYVIGIDIGGTAAKGIDALYAGVSRVVGAVESLNERFGGMDDALEKIGKSAKFSMAKDMAEGLASMTEKVEAFTGRIMDKGQEFVTSIIKDASSFEDAQSGMRFAFGNDWKAVYDQVLADSARLTFSFREVSDLASSLGRMHINPFGGTDKESTEFLSRTGGMIRALDVLQDTADAVGKGTDDLVVSLRNAMAGSWRSLEDRFDIPKEKIKEWRKEIEKLHTPQEKYNKLVSELALMFGGAGAEKAQNFSKAVVQIPDLLEQIRAGTGMEGLKVITKAIFEFVEALGGIAKNKDVMKGLSDGFVVLAEAFAFTIRVGARAIRFIGEIIAAAPWLPKVAAGLALVATGVLVLTTVTLGLAAAGVAAVLVLGALEAEVLIAGAAFAVLLLPALLATGLALGVIGIAAKMASDAITGDKSWGGAVKTMERVKLVFEALGELISTFNGSTGKMSIETAEKLKRMGVKEYVDTLFDVFLNLHAFWDEFTGQLFDISERLGPKFLSVFGKLKDLVLDVADAFGIAGPVATGELEDWEQAADWLADTIGDIIWETLDAIDTLVAWGKLGTSMFKRFKEDLGPVATAFELINGPISKVTETTNGWLNALKAVKEIILMMTGPMYPALKVLGFQIDAVSAVIKPEADKNSKAEVAHPELAGQPGYDKDGNFTGGGNSARANRRMRRGQRLLPGESPEVADADAITAKAINEMDVAEGKIGPWQGPTLPSGEGSVSKGGDKGTAQAEAAAAMTAAAAAITKFASKPAVPQTTVINIDGREVAKALHDLNVGTGG